MKSESFACLRVVERQLLSMQIQTVGLFAAIEGVALDGVMKTLLVGAMHTQLMGATGMGDELDTLMAQRLIRGQGRLAMLYIHHLTGTVQRVSAQGQVYRSAAFHIVF